MCGKKVENLGESSHTLHEFHGYQEQIFRQQQQYNDGYIGGGEGMVLPEASAILPWSIPPVQFASNPVRDLDHVLPPPSYTGLYNCQAASSDPFGLADLYSGSDGLVPGCRVMSSPFSLQAELGKMAGQEIMDAKALAASKSHSEAERRRRERINKHLARLRSLLPSTTKTDKASLLAEVIQHVKDLKRQTSEITEESLVPKEVDELTVDASEEDGKFVIKTSLCCDDRSDLLPDLVKTLKALRLRTLKAEITTLGGRVKNVLLVTGEEDSKGNEQQSINSIQIALKAVMERTTTDDSGSLKTKK